VVDQTLTSAPARDQPPEPRPPALKPLELARWAWRQLTSMRTALVLLFLLALAAVPGSLVPQRSIDAARAAQFAAQHPHLAPWYDRFSLFSVYSSPWFAATYLLAVRLAGGLRPAAQPGPPAGVPRSTAPAPRNLGRLPVHETTTSTRPPGGGAGRGPRLLRAQRFRVDVADGALSAEKGYLRETGNLVFHLALLLLLLSVALGHLFGYKANVLLIEGEAFSNTVTAYDTWTPGALADESSLAPFTVTLDDLKVRYQPSGQQRGAPRDFEASVRYTSSLDAPEKSYVVRVNHPLKVDGTKVFLLGNGYARSSRCATVRDGSCRTGAVPFLPRDGNDTSVGVLKVTGTTPQIGFDGFFLPTAVIDQAGPHSIYPGLKLPRALLSVYTGDLGVDGGTPQSVYSLDKKGLTQVRARTAASWSSGSPRTRR
jgi:cytochrome c biogenesis protein